ncbi:glyceraldehyde-3-phosphate dehydrogenase-like isoform X3 [Leguminivora glycinivorella]|uniref:glyceraldehyde-3-phosphate dehydrogenase-like isoform X3 n=1 Tax=Leguminivora glycinivorella TaxID=1035111 RepID=UPI0020104758|nr:glyceraldehyde-3-phosphate dehydrogenase-like isoform X3 [Leguminivora glycinivorella]XP_047992124.1 glyceraldehyde-3-phosphate dehydrogenase-like isoform X3 [Leguminivora glycinivorella]
MVIKVGINSFGRIGRVIFRTCTEHEDIEVSAINDPAIDLEYMCYLMKFDSTHGKFPGTVLHEGDVIKVNGHSIKVFHHKAPADIPWQDAGVQYVVEASGMFTSVGKASGHLTSVGVRRVVITAPSADAPMLILGVNENTIQPDMKVVSCASSTLYCLAPIIKVLEDAFGVDDGFVTSIHAMTPSLKPLDGLCVRGKHWRDHRSIVQNIIPAATGACRALGKIIPNCKDKLAGLAFRVPVVNGSVLDMTLRSVTLQERSTKTKHHSVSCSRQDYAQLQGQACQPGFSCPSR